MQIKTTKPKIMQTALIRQLTDSSQVQFAAMLFNRTTLNNKLETEQPTQEF